MCGAWYRNREVATAPYDPPWEEFIEELPERPVQNMIDHVFDTTAERYCHFAKPKQCGSHGIVHQFADADRDELGVIYNDMRAIWRKHDDPVVKASCKKALQMLERSAWHVRGRRRAAGGQQRQQEHACGLRAKVAGRTGVREG